MATETASRQGRVVIENAERALGVAQMAALEGAGLSVTTCGGPDALPGGECPVVERGSCSWVDAADVVVHDLDPDDPKHREVLAALRRAYPDVPVVLELPEDTAREHAALLEGCHVIHPFGMEQFVQAVLDALPTTPPVGASS
jgi:hypothetical protein